MVDYSVQNKKAWEYNAYDFWVRQSGSPSERAKKDRENPKRMLKQYAGYFDTFDKIRVANICGSCGKKAIPLAILGADVTVFDISEDNRRYALETAREAQVHIDFEVGDMITVTGDVWHGTVAAIKSINESKRTVTIEVETLGRPTPCELSFDAIKKV